ncbi:MAG: apolipoprotein N-acyltransferase [Verrucomicrobia bacterium]|nr:apolipoprotein N-acyltransferase [Verrucomicrobiota bacterium]MDE3099957.1 apolipoprotein N-acyltransferase [Verrucomicrobiota bacterium]
MPDSPSARQVPLVVDLDGTLLKTDLVWEYLARQLRRNPFSLPAILFWWMRGRACLKRKLANRVQLDPSTLPYNEKFLAWLRQQKASGRALVLATAADLNMALPVADYAGIFDEVLASDGRINLRGRNKLAALTAKFGARGFDYAGNSRADLAVWQGARQAVVVNAGSGLVLRASKCCELGVTFRDDYNPLFIAGRFLNELIWRSGYLAAIVAGLLLAAAFPRGDIAGFAWIAPGLLVFAAGRSGGGAFRAGYIGGMAFWLASLYWLLLIPAAGFPILGWLALCAYLALFPAVWLWLVAGQGPQFLDRASWSGRAAWAFCGAAAWVAVEMVRARLLGGFPWNFIGGSQFQMLPLIQIASVTGVYGVSFIVVWTSLSLLSAVEMMVRRPSLRTAWLAEVIVPFAVVGGIFAFGMVRLAGGAASAPTVRLALVQPSIPQTLIWDPGENARRFGQLLVLSQKALAGQPDVVVWPESAVPEFESSMANYMSVTNFARRHHVWMIFNADDWLPDAADTNHYDVFNSAFLFGPNGDFARVYHKQKLVIFGEYIPLERWLPLIKWLTPITGSFSAGNEGVQFVIHPAQSDPPPGVIELDHSPVSEAAPRTVTVSPLICYEDTFPPLARKAVRARTDFLVNLTNDGWFGDSAEQWQHEANALFRAVENGVPLVRCCNNGVTCWIDAQGRVQRIFRDPAGTVYGPGAMTIEVPVRPHEQTFYNRHGDWFGWGCTAIAGLIALTRGKRSVGLRRRGNI